jgi:hypothetical protein
MLQAYAMSVLMVITYVFKRKMRAMYEPVAETLPLEIATALDLDRHWEVRTNLYMKTVTNSRYTQRYMNPFLKAVF